MAKTFAKNKKYQEARKILEAESKVLPLVAFTSANCTIQFLPHQQKKEKTRDTYFYIQIFLNSQIPNQLVVHPTFF